MSAGLGAGREIVTVCVRGALLTTPPCFCHGAVEGAPMERDTGRNTVATVRGRIRLAHWNRWPFIGCLILSGAPPNRDAVCVHTFAHTCVLTNTRASAYAHIQREGGRKLLCWIPKGKRSFLTPESVVMRECMQFDVAATDSSRGRGAQWG